MRQLLFLFLFSLLGSHSAWAQKFNYERDFDSILSRTIDSTDVLYYQNLEKRFQVNDTSLSDFEVLAILIHFTADEHYAPYSILRAEEHIQEHIKLFQFESAIALGDSVLSIHPYNQEVLLSMAYSYYKLDDLKRADSCRHQFNRIMDAMAWSGNGSKEEPIFSLGSMDSQNFIYEKLSKEITTIGSGLDSWGNLIDIMEVTDQDSDTVVIHFQIQHAIESMFDSNEEEEE